MGVPLSHRRSYQVTISEFRAFLSEASKWADQADMSNALPRDQDNRIRQDVFYDLAEPLMRKGGEYLSRLEEEGRKIPPEESVAHRNFAQTALHPLLLRAPFVYRTFAKPLGYAGDYEMVNQILADPRQGRQHLLSDRQRLLPAVQPWRKPIATG